MLGVLGVLGVCVGTWCRIGVIHATRLFAASRSAAGALVRGATFSPAAPGGRVANRPFIACIWDYCTQLNLARLIMLLGNAPIVQPAEFCPLGMVGL